MADGADRWDGYTTATVTMSRGLDVFHSSDAGNVLLSRLAANPAFMKFEGMVTRLQDLPGRFSLLATVTGQQTSNILFSSEEFGYGGQTLGRAYDSSEITGDQGLAGGLELRYMGWGAVALVLVKLAQLAADVPQVRELDINPLLADRDGVIAVDARVAIAPWDGPLQQGPWHSRFVVRPYPKEWEREEELPQGRRMFVRPVRPEDEALFLEFFRHVTDEDLRLRFFSAVRHFSHEFIARLTQLDYARSIALVALDPGDGSMLGAVRLLADANYESGEYGILVRSDLKGYGIGWRLMQIMIEYAGSIGLKRVEGQVLRENVTMLAMCRHLGFRVRPDRDDPAVMDVTLDVGA